MTRECGACSMCCKLPSIAALNKPADRWCTHCKPGLHGCQIYADRPQPCIEFQCEWLRHEYIPEVWYPASSKMVLNVGPANGQFRFMNVMVDPGTPNRWRESPYHALLRHMALIGMQRNHKIFVRVSSGLRDYIVLPLDDVEVPADSTGIDVIMTPAGDWKLKFV